MPSCYCNAWLSEVDAVDYQPQHNSVKFESRDNQRYTPLPVNSDIRQHKAACLLPFVASFPGSSGFSLQGRNSILSFIHAVVLCPQATTAAPSTASPTTTQACNMLCPPHMAANCHSSKTHRHSRFRQRAVVSCKL